MGHPVLHVGDEEVQAHERAHAGALGIAPLAFFPSFVRLLSSVLAPAVAELRLDCVFILPMLVLHRRLSQGGVKVKR